jgi:phage shock protein C
MTCARCARENTEDAVYCAYCGATQRQPDGDTAGPKRLERSVTDRQIAGVCGGLGVYFGLDAVLVRVLWIILSVVPGAILFGLIAYIAAWLLIPETPNGEPATTQRRLRRSATDSKLAGVCGGMAEYFGVDSTPVRLLWVILSIFPGAIICGVIAYAVAWLVMPVATAATVTTTPATPPTPPPATEPPPTPQAELV